MNFLRALIMVVCLLSVSVSTSYAESKFRVGDQGEDVTEIQAQLVLLGYDVMADGSYGAATVEAVKAFQKAQGIKADGLIGPATYSALLGKDMPEITHGASYMANTIISLAKDYMGVPYVFGGTTPYGFDCSGYVQYVFAKAGISIPRTADTQYDFGKPIATTDLVEGDCVFFETYLPGASHVGIYLGDNKFIHASSSGGVRINSLTQPYYSAHYIGARRMF